MSTQPTPTHAVVAINHHLVHTTACAAVPFLQETVVATVVFADRNSLELFLKLGLHVLQDWLSIRQGVQAVEGAVCDQMDSI
jgi:hypothetical protein